MNAQVQIAKLHERIMQIYACVNMDLRLALVALYLAFK